MRLRRRGRHCRAATAAPRSPCPSSGTRPTSCCGTTASPSRDTTSTADGASTVRPPLAAARLRRPPGSCQTCRHSLVCGFIFRAQTVGGGSVSGDEHPVQVLVLLPEGQLQQEDVRGVQAVFAGRRQRKQQVCVCVLDWPLSQLPSLRHGLSLCAAGTDWNASSDSTATVWRRGSDKICSRTFKKRPCETLRKVRNPRGR